MRERVLLQLQANTNAILRAGNGAVDTNNNAADFATGAPNPRNSFSSVPNLSINDVSLNEGNSGTTSLTSRSACLRLLRPAA
jgi:uncharacterized protein